MFTSLLISLLLSGNVLAKDDIQKEIRVLFKCHGQLVRERLNPTHFLVKEIQNKKINGSEACLKLLETAEFSEKGLLKEENNFSSQKILKTIQAFHNNWFPRFDFNIYTQDHPNVNVFDKNEMGYHLTWSLLSKNTPYSQVLTNPGSFRGVRKSEVKNKFSNDKAISGTRYELNDPNRKWMIGGLKENDYEFGKEYVYRPRLIAFGSLVGLEKMLIGENSFERVQMKGPKKLIDLSFPKFNGVMGTVPYLLLNAGQNKRRTDGGNVLHRRWSTSVFKDLLCRTHPLVREEDSKKSVIKKSSIGFRKTNACMNCHYPIDALAPLTRNIELFNAGEVNGSYFTFRAIDNHKSTLPHLKDVVDSDLNYYKRRPVGKLVYRSVEGKLIDKRIENPNDLGEYLSKQDAPYFCAAKRYFKFFTAVDVHLYDFSQFSVKEEQKKFLTYRSFILKIGKNLKKHQSLKKLIAEIFASPFYRDGVAHE